MNIETKICSVAGAIAGKAAWTELHGYGEKAFYYACVELPNGDTLKVPGKTRPIAACELLARMRRRFPENLDAAKSAEGYAEAMAAYADHVDAQTDAMIEQIRELRTRPIAA